MKRLLIMTIASLLYGMGVRAQNSVQVVKAFGDAMQEWCNTDDISIRIEKLDKITGGDTSKCRIDDEVSRLMFENKKEFLKSNFDISVYLDQIRDAIISSKGQKFQMANITSQPNFVAPTAFKDEIPPTFVSADLMLKGYYNCNTTDLFYVRGNNITKMVDFMSDESLGKAIALYSQKKYDDAFRIFRKLAYADFTNFDAQYYMVVMEFKEQGCDHLDKTVRDQEMAWFIAKNYNARKRDAVRLAERLSYDRRKMSYAHFPFLYGSILIYKKPMNSGRMMSFDTTKKKCGFVDEKGKLVIEHKYDCAFPFHEGLAMVVSKDKYGFIDSAGNEIVPMVYKNALCDYYKGRTYCVDTNGNCCLIDKNGKVLKVIENHPYLIPYTPVGQYALLFKTRTVFDVFDYEGNLVYADCDYWAVNLTDGIIRVKKGEKIVVEYKIEW